MERANLALVIPIRIADEDIVTQRFGDIQNPARNFREKWICDIAEDQPNRIGVLGDQRTRQLARSIAELLDGKPVTRCRVASEISPWLFTTRETVLIETPAS